jgi:hypothetical protein
VQVDLFAASAKISATPQTVNGGQSETASAWLLAPIRVAGPEFRLYLTNSPTFCGRQRLRDVLRQVWKLYLDGRYGWVDSNQAPRANAGYQLGSRLVVTNNSSSDRIGLRLTQRGAVAGFELLF